MGKFEDIVKGIHFFYQFIQKRRREVKAASEFYGQNLAHISVIKQVGWLSSKTRAFLALLVNYQSIVGHLEHIAAKNSSDESARAKGYLKEMTTANFVMMLQAMVDIFEVTSELSKVFQRDDLLVTDVYQEVEICVIKLEALKHEPRQKLKKFMDTFDKETNRFESTQLKGQLPDNKFLDEIIDVLSKYIDKR